MGVAAYGTEVFAAESAVLLGEQSEEPLFRRCVVEVGRKVIPFRFLGEAFAVAVLQVGQAALLLLVGGELADGSERRGGDFHDALAVLPLFAIDGTGRIVLQHPDTLNQLVTVEEVLMKVVYFFLFCDWLPVDDHQNGVLFAVMGTSHAHGVWP